MEEGKGGTRHRASTFFIFLVIYINESEKMHLRVFSNIDLTEPEPTALPIFNNLEFATRSITLKTEARKKKYRPRVQASFGGDPPTAERADRNRSLPPDYWFGLTDPSQNPTARLRRMSPTLFRATASSVIASCVSSKSLRCTAGR